MFLYKYRENKKQLKITREKKEKKKTRDKRDTEDIRKTFKHTSHYTTLHTNEE